MCCWSYIVFGVELDVADIGRGCFACWALSEIGVNDLGVKGKCELLIS